MLIHIKDIVALGIHGCLSREKKKGQRFRVSISFALVTPSVNDELDETVDWKEVRDVIIHSIENESFSLVETLATHIAQTVQLLDTNIKDITVHVEKLDAWDNGVPSVTVKG
ncbi:dihydroneopterin aldolase [Candidatus Kaiserbacteria bacterium]|nr:MAG: dihydroneopterin aldolase [Candidatus Kaiserbacteria bacterium]